MKKIRLKKKVKKSFLSLCILIFIATLCIRIYKNYKYKQTNEYKLTTVGYTLKESKIIINELNSKNELYFVNHKKNRYIINLLEEKYFLEKNLYEYLNYINDNKSKSLNDVIAIVNVKANKEWYDKDTIRKTDMKKGNLILVNKFNYLESDYVPNDITKINLSYAYSDNSVTKETNDAYINMAENAKKDGIILLANSSYRDYERQEKVYKEFYYSRGINYADNYAARAGFSEHQTGLAIDIFTNDSNTDNFDKTEAFKWLINNSYKYGFILRYPKGKEYLTGYNYESWHYRYLGRDTAKKVYESNLTYDEYYAYYLDK